MNEPTKDWCIISNRIAELEDELKHEREALRAIQRKCLHERRVDLRCVDCGHLPYPS